MLWRYALFSCALGMAGLPIYIHAPKYFVEQYEINLATLGLALLLLRSVDFFQDPLLGRLASSTLSRGSSPLWIATAFMCLGMILLFAIPAVTSPILWFSISLIILFSGFSFAYIRIYAFGVEAFGMDGQIKIAKWREGGTLIGICLAAAAPSILSITGSNGYKNFAFLFCALIIIATFLMTSDFSKTFFEVQKQTTSIFPKDVGLQRLLLFVFLNAMPVAVTSTLYLFYVDHVLGLEVMGGPLLILFFLSAAFSAPFWTRWAEHYGALQVLRVSMLVSILSFVWAYNLNAGEVIAFSIICFATGLSLGADMTILPAIFAQRLAKTKHDPNTGFGIWNFSNKLALAFTAGILLPLMEFAGFETQDMRSSLSTEVLKISYAIVPCGLKIFALIWLQNLIGRDKNL
jgi:GPH family glycoside/pentoside/hexuronide:cation symporter